MKLEACNLILLWIGRPATRLERYPTKVFKGVLLRTEEGCDRMRPVDKCVTGNLGKEEAGFIDVELLV